MFTKFAQLPGAGDQAWNQWLSGRRQAVGQLREAAKIRPAQSSLMEHRVAEKYPMLNWFMTSGDVARLDPRMAGYRAQLAKGRFTPGTPLSFYTRPTGWGWTNPFGVRNWFGDTSDVARRQEVIEKIRGSRTLKNLLEQYRGGTLRRSELERLVPGQLKDVVTPAQMEAADLWRQFHRNQAAMARARPKMTEALRGPTSPYAGQVPIEVIDPLVEYKRHYAGDPRAFATKGGSEKVATFDWVLRRGNRAFDVELEKALEDPQAMGAFMTKHRGIISGQPEKAPWYSWLNPFSWGRKAYMSDPRAQAHMKEQLSRRLRASDTAARLFPQRHGRARSLFELMGPIGIGGTAALLTGALTKSPWLALAGLGGLGYQGYTQYQRARDPQTWLSAFAKARTPAEQAAQERSRRYLANVTGLLHGKTASVNRVLGEKMAFLSNFMPGDIPYEPPGQEFHNEQAIRLLHSHFPVREGRKSIVKSTNLTMGEKMDLIKAFDRATDDDTGRTGRGLTTFQKVLPSLAGAGLGWLGASLAAPVLGFDKKTKGRFRIGSAALGAILNNPHLTRKIF